MVERSGQTKAARPTASAEGLRALLADAENALRSGETQEAERQAKAISALVRAARDIADLEAFARAQPQEQDEQALRAELRSRIARFLKAAEAGAPDAVLERIGLGASAEGLEVLGE